MTQTPATGDAARLLRDRFLNALDADDYAVLKDPSVNLGTAPTSC